MIDRQWLKTPKLSQKLKIKLCIKTRPTVVQDDWETAMLPGQFRSKPNKGWEERCAEEKLAWAFLERLLLDITGVAQEGMSAASKARRQLRQARAIAETYLWMNNDLRWAEEDDSFEYPFDYWCELLEIDEGYMKRGLKRLLVKSSKDLKAQEGYKKRKLN